MLGDFNDTMTVKDLLSDCDTGIGTYEGLDGEALIVDGVAYKGTADGTVVKMADTDKLAFSTVTKFDHSVKEQTITNVEDIKTLKEKLQPIVDQNKNIFYMFLAHAKFSKMHVRSCYKCASHILHMLKQLANKENITMKMKKDRLLQSTALIM